MPKYGIEEEDRPKSKLACSGLRDDLKECLLKSDCVRRDGRTPRQCLELGQHESIPEQCMAFRAAFFECKRSLLDMRQRFRGKKGY